LHLAGERGHLPPLVIAGDRSRVVDVPATTPLGTYAYGRYPETEVRLAPGEILALYTDGLVERRRADLTDGIERLVDVLAGVKGLVQIEETVEQAFDTLAGTEPNATSA
jgi:serine phosphatase RsbU (regulator of sigma subunit)